MPVTQVQDDPERLALRLAVEVGVPPAQVWECWSDADLLARWWGPPDYPATVVAHDLTVGGRTAWYLTSPEGDQYHGWWTVSSLDPGRSAQLESGFAHDDGEPNPRLPVTQLDVRLDEPAPGRTVLTLTMSFRSLQDMRWMYRMGNKGSMELALRRLEALLGGRG